MRNKRKHSEKKGAPEWMTTYSDMVTLLLCFFVLLFSFSSVDAQKFQAIMNSFQGSLGVLEGGKTIQEGPSLELDDILEDSADLEMKELEDLRKLKELIDNYTEEIKLSSKISTIIEERGLLIRALDNVYFDSGKANLKQESKKILKYIAEILQTEEFNEKFIKIEGHTDTDPVRDTRKFPTNWELSAIRATNVLRFLVEENNIKGDRISATGYSYYRPIAPNDTVQNKAKNRRVDIIILKSVYSE